MMMSLAMQATLVLGILKAVAVVGNVVPRDGMWDDGPPYVVSKKPVPRALVFPGPSDADFAKALISSVYMGVNKRPSQCLNLPDPGECRGAFPRYFYNVNLDQCDCFLYGGCDNDALLKSSSWVSLTECASICRPGNTEEGPRCKLLPEQDIETFFTQPDIVESPDTSHINDQDFLYLF